MSNPSGKDQTLDNEVFSDAFFEARRVDLAKRLGQSRLEHTVDVAKTAEKLASLYAVDPLKARLAGLLHDWDKNYNDEGIRVRCVELGLSVDSFVFEEMPQLLHGQTAAIALAKAFPSLPPDVICAIERHTAGAVGMSDLDMVVYVADALEPGRRYAGLQLVRDMVGQVSLEQLYLATFRHVLLNLIERQKRIHPQTIEIWNYYIARSRKVSGKKPAKGNL